MLRAIAPLPLAVFLLSAPCLADILVGVAGPMNGQYAAFGNELKAGAEAAADAVNLQGGINGEMLSVVSADDACDTKRAVDVAKDFVVRDVRVVIGHFCSGASLAAAHVYAEAGIVMLSPSASNPELTESNLWNVFRLTGRDDAQADFAAQAVKQSANAVAAVISDGSAYDVALATRFTAMLPQAPTITIKSGQTELQDIVDATVKTYSHIYLATGTTDALRLIEALRNGGFTGQILAGDAVVSEAFTTKADATADGLRATFPADQTQSGSARSVASDLVASGKTADGAVIPAYAAVQAFATAARATSVNDGKAMAKWLHGNGVNTILGSLAFDAKGDLTAQPFVWYQFNAGNFRLEQN